MAAKAIYIYIHTQEREFVIGVTAVISFKKKNQGNKVYLIVALQSYNTIHNTTGSSVSSCTKH